MVHLRAEDNASPRGRLTQREYNAGSTYEHRREGFKVPLNVRDIYYKETVQKIRLNLASRLGNSPNT